VSWPEIPEADARGATHLLYGEIRETLGVEHVPLLYRTLAASDAALGVLWPSLRPLLEADAAERFGEEAREAARRYALAAGIPRIELLDEVAEETRAVLRAYNTANPRNLLFALAARRMVGSVRGRAPDGAPAQPGLGPPPAGDDPELVLDDIRRAHGGGGIPGVYRALARRPADLAALWRTVRPHLRSVEMRAAQQRLREGGAQALEVLEHPPPLDGPSRPSLAALLDWFVEAIPAVIVEIELLKLTVSAPTRPNSRAKEAV
jgi:hypothetical protein